MKKNLGLLHWGKGGGGGEVNLKSGAFCERVFITESAVHNMDETTRKQFQALLKPI